MKSLITRMMEESDGYKQTKNTENVQVNIKTGSVLNPTFVTMKGTLKIPDKYSIHEVLDVLMQPEGRQKWDQILYNSGLIKQISKNILVKYYTVKIPISIIQNRDFVVKQIVFRSGNYIYYYETSVDDSFYPPKSGITRGTEVFVADRIHIEKNEIILETVSQIDMKFNLPAVMVSAKMSEGLENFRNNLINKLNESHIM